MEIAIITTDKIAYKQREIVNINISNKTSQEISYYWWLGWNSIFIEKQSGGTWKTLDIGHPIDMRAYLKKLQPGEDVKFEWNQTKNDRLNYPNRVPVTIGIYRILFIYWIDCPFDSPTKDCKKYSIYSKEFRIK